ncbi:MAG: hypothetical protein AAGJ69_05260 [Cyanobacteria bacterium J06559_1]
MLNKVTEYLLQLSVMSIAPLVIAGTARPILAQAPEEIPEEIPKQTTAQSPVASPPEASANILTICRYDPNSGIPNVLGMRTYVSLTERDGDTVVTLDRFPSFVSSADSPNRRADVSEVRSLNLYDTPIATARQLLIEQPAYYAALMEIDEADIEAGFAPINETLGCGQVVVEPDPTEATTAAAPENPTAETSEAETGAMQVVDLDLPNLPNGNYRFVSANFPNRVVSETELTESGGVVFLFRKFGENITGTFRYIGQERNVCISGTVDGNTVVGTAYRRGSQLQENSFLKLREEVEETEYAGSTLNLEGFSRINAGGRLPLESCS